MKYQMFVDMKKNNETRRIMTSNPFYVKYSLEFDLSDLPVSTDVIDYKLVDEQTGMIGFLFSRYGLVLCMLG